MANLLKKKYSEPEIEIVITVKDDILVMSPGSDDDEFSPWV